MEERESVFTRLAKNPLVACLVLATTTILAFWPVVHAGFINYDDTDYVTANVRVQAGLTWKSVAWAFTANHASNWHPLTWLSHMLDVDFFGKGAAGPHCVNLLLHVLNSFLLFCFLRRVTSAHWRSLVVAGLFALHPLHVESVAWVSERKDVLSTFFGMLTLLAYAQYVAQSKFPGLKSKAFYVLALVLFALGLMSKPMLVTLPCVMLLLDYWPLQRFQPSPAGFPLPALFRLAGEKAPFFLLSAAACVLTTWAQKQALAPLVYLPLTDRIANVLVSYCRYLGKMIWPANLALPYLNLEPWPDAQVALAAILLAGLCLVAMLAGRKQPYVFTGWFWYVGTLIPVIGLVQVGVQSMADRYTYIPLIGIFIVLVWSAGEACVRWRLPPAAVAVTAALVILGGGVLTHQQAGYWHDTESLFTHSAAVTPNNFIALSNVGGSLFERGQVDKALDYYHEAHRINPNYPEAINSIGAVLASKGSDEAIVWFHKVLALQPTHADALFNLGNAMARKENLREAAKYFEASVRVRPDNFEAQNNLGNTLFKLGNMDEAIHHYELALENNPEAAVIHKNLGEAHAAKGRLDLAVRHYQQALKQTNDSGVHYSLGLTLAVQGKWDDAIEHYTATVRLSPTNAVAQYNLGYAFRVQGRLDQAEHHLGEAVRLNPDFPLAQFNLGCVLLDRGRAKDAMEHLREAVRLKPDYREAQQKLQALEAAKIE